MNRSLIAQEKKRAEFFAHFKERGDDLLGNSTIGSLCGSGTEQSWMYLPQGSLV